VAFLLLLKNMETILLLGLLGLMFGSFANVCIYRLPLEQSLFFPASHCPHCQKPVLWRDNIPVLGFLLLKGKCRGCRARISFRYIAIELITALFFMGGLYFLKKPHGLILLVIYLWLAFNWITITVIDYLHRIIPDELSLSLIGFGWILAAWNPLLGETIRERLLQSVLSSLAWGAGMIFLAWAGEKIFKKEALGGGDVKLLAGYGAVLGWSGAAASLVIGSFIGGMTGLLLMLAGRKKLGQTIPFGPFLNLGSVVGLFFPNWWHYFFPLS
jgi:leader peptidase (prepilin peptidase)/N-methyltransferase